MPKSNRDFKFFKKRSRRFSPAYDGLRASLSIRKYGGIILNSKESAAAVCGYKCGALPSCAPLAVGFVPAQENAQARYEPDKALARGTLFPGLDLPLGSMVNDAAPNVPLAELMAIDFAAHDLSLYLDTHANDKEAFAAYQDLLKLAEEGAQRYAKLYGPITKRDLLNAETYTWLKSPWPWEYRGDTEG